MTIPFIHRDPSAAETDQLRLLFSTFTDGSGMLMLADGYTLPGWRDFERVFAELFRGHAPENKAIFDVVVECPAFPNEAYGLSVKSKKLSRLDAIRDLDNGGRVYMELTNSPAKLWDALRAAGIPESDWGAAGTEAAIGQCILDTVCVWHHEGAAAFAAANAGKRLDLDNSVFLVVSYADPKATRPREYQIHSFEMAFPAVITWNYLPRTKNGIRCIRGLDPDGSGEAIIDWYPFSGGQLKYYPRARTAKHKSDRFELAPRPPLQRIAEKARTYWPADWPT